MTYKGRKYKLKDGEISLEGLQKITGLNVSTLRTFLGNYQLSKYVKAYVSPLTVYSTIFFWEDFISYLVKRQEKRKIPRDCVKNCEKYLNKVYKYTQKRLEATRGA